MSSQSVTRSYSAERYHEYGDKTYSQIDSIGSVNLKGTFVDGSVSVAGSCKCSNAYSKSINAGGSIHLINSSCVHALKAGSSITLVNSTAEALSAGKSISMDHSCVTSDITAGDRISSMFCQKLGKMVAGGPVEVEDCDQVLSISSVSHVSLIRSTVIGNVTCGTSARVENAKINGKFLTSASRLLVRDSTIDTIEIQVEALESLNEQKASGTESLGNKHKISMLPNGEISFSEIEPIQYRRSFEEAVSGGEKVSLTVELVNSTVNKVIFQAGNGVVILRDKSQVLYEIVGGNSETVVTKRRK